MSGSVRRKLDKLVPANRGDATSFVARIEGVSFGDAVRKLAVRCGLAPRNDGFDLGRDQTDTPILCQALKTMAAARKVPGLSGQTAPTLPYFPELEDPDLKTGHLAYKGRLARLKDALKEFS